MSVTFRVLGDGEVIRKFGQISDAAQGGAIVTALLSAAQLVINAAQENLRALGSWITGNLARSIAAKIVGVAKVAVGTDVVYGPRVEFGFTGADALGRIYNQAPRPYLRPALDENRDEILREVADTMRALFGALA